MMNSENENQKDEIHRKIGRNLVLLQKIEQLLKVLIVKGNLSFQINHQDAEFPSFEEQLKRQKDSVQKNTLGCLERRFSTTVLAPFPEVPVENDPNAQTSSIRFRLSHGPDESQDRLKDRLKMVTSGRNKLVHELLTSFNLNTNDGLEELDNFLEQQYKILLPLVNEIEKMHETCVTAGKAFLERFKISKIPEDCGKMLCVSKLLVCLCLFENYKKKTEYFEWINLALAKKYLNSLFPEAIPECRRHYSVMSLKKILCKIGIFDVQRLSVNHGKEMVYYRMKHEYSMEKDESGELYICTKDALDSGGYFEEKASLQMFI